VINVSSGAGVVAHMTGGWAGYKLSKAALNGLTRILACELEGSGVAVYAASPGAVRTRSGEPSATRTPREGAEVIAWLATTPDAPPGGAMYTDRRVIPW
jgi:NAD(P)-dependent dehydrogenase (short-subunit alcohol dehydrogenase family)